jgi:hypothetical protein
MVGHKFSLVLNREVTEDESVILKEASYDRAIFTIDSLPANADVAVTRMDFDDAVSSSLGEAIGSALIAVNKVPDLSVPCLTVPSQPVEGVSATVDEEPITAAEKPSAKANGEREPVDNVE